MAKIRWLFMLQKHFSTVVIATTILVVAFKFKDVLKGGSDDNLDSDETFNVDGSNFTEVQAKSIADNFASALMTSFKTTGDDKLLVYKQFDKMSSQEDFNAVFNAFGKRQYSVTWGNIGDPITSDKRDLIFILNNELHIDDKEHMKSKYPFLQIF